MTKKNFHHKGFGKNKIDDPATGFMTAMDRRTFLSLSGKISGMALLGLTLANCGPSEPETPSQSIQMRPDKIIMGSAVDLYTIDPAIGFDSAISSSLKNLYDALFRHVGNPPRAIPWLAESHEVSKDTREWIFKLSKNAVFHDNTPVTAEAVKYSANRMLRINKGPANLFSGIMDKNSVKVLDSHTIKISLLQPFGPFLHTLPWLFVVNPEKVQAHAGKDDGQTWLSDHAEGSGPFTIGDWKPGNIYEFKAVENYWRGWPDKKHLKSYVRKVINDNENKTIALELGEVDMVDWASPEVQVKLKDKGFTIVETPTLEIYEVKLNNQRGFTADRHVRKAISYAFDYKTLKKTWKDRATILNGPLPPGLEFSYQDREPYHLDLKKAQQELAKSPWPDGGFLLDYVYVTGLEEERITGELLRDQLALLNITVNIIPMAWADAVTTFNDFNTAPSMFPIYSSKAYPDPDNYLWSGYHSSQAGQWTNPGHYKNPDLDILLETARKTVEKSELKIIYGRIQKTILDDAVNIFCLSTPDHHILSPRIKNYTYCPVMGSDEDFYYLQTAD
ncbi:MAG: ABC transporter substrate-binding protein [Proteobacteria bacterium]|nr:ABC transporter substrate-binding protein [Pseudomonadota bacterium]MBU1584699.1 ABC transporter substrate-binding protein [Pseudomonadota bacterium]MBU2455631.1 ABC transporter substrate-binding protein [Pseudomonadota bacterium]